MSLRSVSNWKQIEMFNIRGETFEVPNSLEEAVKLWQEMRTFSKTFVLDMCKILCTLNFPTNQRREYESRELKHSRMIESINGQSKYA